MVVARACFRHCLTIWPAEVMSGGKGATMMRGQEKTLMLLGGFWGGLTGRITARKISVVGCLLWGFLVATTRSEIRWSITRKRSCSFCNRRDEPWH